MAVLTLAREGVVTISGRSALYSKLLMSRAILVAVSNFSMGISEAGEEPLRRLSPLLRFKNLSKIVYYEARSHTGLTWGNFLLAVCEGLSSADTSPLPCLTQWRGGTISAPEP